MNAKDGDAAGLVDSPVCGIVMPISEIDGCTEEHWKDVLQIIWQAVRAAKMVPALVSDSVDVGIIHKRIVQNLYDNPLIICDVSGRNPNVMFELGMRLAFDKPIIMIKDNQTPYSFDSSPIEHIVYPRDLRFQSIVDFQENLTAKIKHTLNSGGANSFLRSFGKFKVAEIEKESVPANEMILEELRSLRSQVLEIGRDGQRTYYRAGRPTRRGVRLMPSNGDGLAVVCFRDRPPTPEIRGSIKAVPGIHSVPREERVGDSHWHLNIILNEDADEERVRADLARRVNMLG